MRLELKTWRGLRPHNSWFECSLEKCKCVNVTSL